MNLEQITNWHRYVLVGLGMVGTILTAIIAQPALVPPPLAELNRWAPFLLLIDGSVVAFLPRAQLPTGPGAPDIVSPPAKDVVPHG